MTFLTANNSDNSDKFTPTWIWTQTTCTRSKRTATKRSITQRLRHKT